MLVNTIMKESASGVNLKAEIIDENTNYAVKYYINGTLSGITSHTRHLGLGPVEEAVEQWFQNVKPLNG